MKEEICMTKVWRFGLIVAAALALGFAFVGCDTTTGGGAPPKSIKITGITLTSAETNGEGGMVICKKYTDEGNLGAAGVIVAREIWHEPHITNGELLFDLYVSNGWDATNKPWTGSGKYAICLQIAGTDGWDDEGGHHHRYWWTKDGEYAKYDIKDALTTLEFSQFKKEW
jgi:hypothetical protein